MKALLSITPGGPETLVLGERPDPKPGPGQIVIRVRACGVNFPDSLVIQDLYQFKPPRPFAPGGEVSGEIEALGPGVTGFAVGQRVMATMIWGGMAEKATVKASDCVAMPDGMSFEEGAGFLLTYATALYGLRDRGGLKPGERVLVLGAAGGVGIAAIQTAKALGAIVVAGVSSAEKAALAKAEGADETIVYPRGPFDAAGTKALADLFKTGAGKDGYNLVFDIVGGAYAEAGLRAIAWEGRLLVVGFPAGIPKLPLNLVLLKSCQVVGVFYGAFTERSPAGVGALLRDLAALYEKGALKPLISARVPLARGGEAVQALSDRRATGKLVVTIP